MNKILSLVSAVMCAAMVGCTTMPSESQLSTASRLAGVTTALVVNNTQKDMSVESRMVVVDIIGKIKTNIPSTNEMPSVVWTQIVTEYINVKLSESKITSEDATKITKIFTDVVNGVEYILYKKYPKIMEYQNLVVVTIDGFADGFLSYFSTNPSSTSSTYKVEYDKEMYDYLMSVRK